MMTLLATANMAPRTHELTATINETGHSSFCSERPRKYSGCYGEIEAVDCLRGVGEVVTPREPTSLTSESRAKLQSPLETTSDIKGDRTRDTTASDNTVSSSMPGDASEASSLAKALPLQKSESFLRSLPVASATPEIATATLPTATVDAVATHVIRIPKATTEMDRQASLISVKVFKASPKTKLGIRLQLSNDGSLQVGKLTGFLADSPLRMGDDLLRLDGKNVSAWTTSKTLKYLKETWGWISIVVRNPRLSADPTLCLASVCKSTPSDKLGISFERLNDGRGDKSPLLIRGLNVAGLLGGRTIIRAGDVVEAINHVPCAHVETSAAVNMIRSVPSWVHILFRTNPDEFVGLQYGMAAHNDVQVASNTQLEDDNETALDTRAVAELAPVLPLDDRDEHLEPSILSLTLYKYQKSDQLGLSLVKLNDGIYICKISGFLGGSILKEGMRVLAINHKLTAHMTFSEATAYLKDRVGSITIIAQNPHGNPKYVQAMVYKKASEKSRGKNLVGISFKGYAGRQLKVCEIRNDGLFVESCLNVGDSILRINDVPCRHSRPKDAVDLVRASEQRVSILAKSRSKAGVVVARLSSSGGPPPNFVAPRTA